MRTVYSIISSSMRKLIRCIFVALLWHYTNQSCLNLGHWWMGTLGIRSFNTSSVRIHNLCPIWSPRTFLAEVTNRHHVQTSLGSSLLWKLRLGVPPAAAMGARSLSGSDDAPGDGVEEFEVELAAIFCSGHWKINLDFFYPVQTFSRSSDV